MEIDELKSSTVVEWQKRKR